MTTITYTEQLVVESCPACHVRHGIPESLRRRALDDHRIGLWCPNGHRWVFTGQTDAEKLQDELDRERRRVAFERQQREAERQAREHAESQARGYKGALTKAKKRSAAGVCPAPGCKRSFTDVSDHVRTCHPELVGDLPLDGLEVVE